MSKQIDVNITGSIKGISVTGHKATMFKGIPLADCPKTYKRLGVIGHSIGNDYNPSHLVVYVAKDKTLRYEIYRDGSIFPFYGKLLIHDFNLSLLP